MKNLLRLTAAVNRVEVCDPETTLANLKLQLASLDGTPWDLLVLPRMSLCSVSTGDLLGSRALLDCAAEQLENLCILTQDRQGAILVGLPFTSAGRPVEGVALLQGGRVQGCIPLGADAALDGGYPVLPRDGVLSLGGVRTVVAPGDPEELLLQAGELKHLGCQLVVVPAYAPAIAGSIDRAKTAAEALSRLLGCGVLVVNGGVGDTSSPWCYQGYTFLYENGVLLGEAVSHGEPISLTRDVDGDILAAVGKADMGPAPVYTLPLPEKAGPPLRPVAENPYLPQDPTARRAYLTQLFELQVNSLAARLRNTGIDRLVIGVSGGLDSTLALLVSAAACDRLSIPRQNIYGVTMPGFGTTDRTYFNALGLIEALGAASRDISIRAAVLQHFEDIGQSPAQRDVTYENAQARERTQVLLDLANRLGGLVVGTGDLTEEALGWCTFAGDHISNYNVNVCLTKAMIREVVALVAEDGRMPGTEDILRDILDTPVSPELLPPTESGEMAQKSEEILGPYELHDFFLWYLAYYGMAPAKVLDYAVAAFGDRYTVTYLREKLRLFVRRFLTSQFKRSCAPDTACITEFNLTGVRYAFPSDLSPRMLLRELDPAGF